VALRRKIAAVSGNQLQPVLLGEGSLEGVGQFPAVLAPQNCGRVSSFLVDRKRGKCFKEALCQRNVLRRKPGQNLGAGDYRNPRIPPDRFKVGGSLGIPLK